MDKKSFILDFISKQSLMTISTIASNGKPEAALIGFGQTNNFEIIFGTSNSSRKYTNILGSPSVALVIGWGDTRTVQYEGIASELSRYDIQLVKDNYWKKTPSAEKHDKNPAQRYFMVKPTWVRYTDLRKDPWEIFEIIF